MIEDEISNVIRGCAIDVHRTFGPGLLESAYRECLYYDLTEKGLVVELKRTEAINDVHIAQLLTYLKLGNYRLGLIINFQNKLLKDGIKRIIN